VWSKYWSEAAISSTVTAQSIANAALSFLWMAVWPGLAIFLSVLSFNLVGDGLRDAFDPRKN
jgi:ABC-type dipeptide/oligopeptide/nickel transport system permease subunit